MMSSGTFFELLFPQSGWSADANGGTLESLGYKEGFRVDVDIPDGTWAEAPSFHDILIFNTGHCWPRFGKVYGFTGQEVVFGLLVEELFSLKNNGTNVETRLVNQHLYKALKGSDFHILEITRMNEFRADAHPSTAGEKKHDDCMDWCLPGTTDTWNDLFITHLNNIKFQN
ncbi:protein trichome birefringence-like 13 [Vitis vinifera]|uniref:Protein trichome birefringence-like 13 n=1 Tax=Vitis vinifera TaxID=29760 RepID=A0A438JMV5_VITVI|nr:protein trichome birefringence-like 13 [Vitis vinifera]RVX10300.1 Protein trichome birefringence-like 13 [Vitis vinifera]|eukprot:XP_019074399.1 PREDICTED: protein trichome birefringence-like 13 [Vitis vinifera]